MRHWLLVVVVTVIGGWLADSALAGHRCRGCGAGYGSAAAVPRGYSGYAHTAYGGYPSGIYAYRATYGYGYYRPYGTYYGPGYYSYSYGAFPGVYPPGYLPPRYYGGYGYWGGRGSGYYYGAGPRVSVGVNY